MTMSADAIVDRRRLRRKLSFWRVVAFLLLAVAVIGGVLYAMRGTNPTVPGGAQIARVSITGLITENRDQLQMLDRIGRDDSVKGVILAIDSSGGTTAGGEALFNAVRKLAALKPTVATLGTVAASAAYMTAIATDRIIARRSTITGSIGVIFQYPEVSALLDKIGVNVQELKSSPLKAEPSPFHPPSDEANAVMQSMIADTYRWFLDIVSQRRGLNPTEMAAIGDGRVLTGNQAVAAKLVDEIGGEPEARAWLEGKGVTPNLPIRDWRPSAGRGFFSLSDAAVIWISKQLGVAPEVVKLLGVEDVLPIPGKLDGLLSLWQAPFDRRDSEGAPR